MVDFGLWTVFLFGIWNLVTDFGLSTLVADFGILTTVADFRFWALGVDFRFSEHWCLILDFGHLRPNLDSEVWWLILYSRL